MKKSELLAMIAHVPDDGEIVLAVPTGNYWKQTKAISPTDIRAGVIVRSDYLEGDEVLSPEDEDKTVLVDETTGEEVSKNGVYDPTQKAYYSGHPVREAYILF